MLINSNSELLSKVISILYVGKLDISFVEQGYNGLRVLRKKKSVRIREVIFLFNSKL